MIVTEINKDFMRFQCEDCGEDFDMGQEDHVTFNAMEKHRQECTAGWDDNEDA